MKMANEKVEDAKVGDKRKAEDEEPKKTEDSESEDDGWIGPMPSEATPAKKKKILEFEKIYLNDIPDSESYEKSFMHRDVIVFSAVTSTDFLVTASQDGHVKFWKKQPIGIEFVKHFRAHLGNIQDVSINHNGTLLCTISNDKNAKIFDVINFDMINMIRLGYAPECNTWIHGPSDAVHALAIAESETTKIHIYDGKDPSSAPLKTLDRIHMSPILVLTYNPKLDIAVSSDEKGMIEFWSGLKNEYQFPEKYVNFESKLDTDLFDFAKNKTRPLNLTVSPNGKFLAAFSADRKIRIFRFQSGKLYCVLDESHDHYAKIQAEKQILPSMDFNRKISNDKDIEKAGFLRYNNIVFDKTSNFILYSCLMGIKLVNIYSNKGVRILGKSENLRFLNLGFFQGLIKKTTAATSVEVEASDNPGLDIGVSDPTLFATAYKKNRFYCFSKREPREAAGSSAVDSDRDVFNEKPSKEEIIQATEEKGGITRLYENATIHTCLGDIHVQLFPRECPKTVENFCVHSKNGYFNQHIFHRVIKQFMVQTGDPTGVGTGGESIWGGEFEDEFHPKLRHDRPYTLSMANAGPNTNGSQFFITVLPTPWLDNKHTVFGRVVKGMEVAQNISNVKVHPKTDKPYDDISIVSVSLKNPVRL